MRAVDEGGGDGVAGALGRARGASDLVEGCLVGGGGREGVFVVVVMVLVWAEGRAGEVDGVGEERSGTDGSRDEGAERGEEGERWGWWHG